MTTFEFESVFVIGGVDRWYDKAMVRTRSKRVAEPPWDETCSLYSAELTPWAAHPLVEQLGPRAVLELGGGRLADYLAKTEIVELDIVNRAVESILRLPAVSEEMRQDLLKVYTDEGYHVLMMSEFRREMMDRTGIWLGRRPLREFRHITALMLSLPPEQRELGIICSAVVTETLITATLRQAGGDSVYPLVTRMLTEHAADESRHHAFFHRFAEAYFPQLSASEKQAAEQVLRRVLWHFLMPDFARLHDDLVGQGLTGEQAAEVIDESHDRQALREQFLSASLASRRLLTALGLEAAEAFEADLDRLERDSLLAR